MAAAMRRDDLGTRPDGILLTPADVTGLADVSVQLLRKQTRTGWVPGVRLGRVVSFSQIVLDGRAVRRTWAREEVTHSDDPLAPKAETRTVRRR